MMRNRNKRWKAVIAALAVFAAGICYILTAGAGRAGRLAQLRTVPAESALSREDVRADEAGDGEVGDDKADDGRSSDGKAGDGRSSDGKAGDGGSSDGRAGDGRSGDGGGPTGGADVSDKEPDVDVTSSVAVMPETEPLLWVHVCGEVRSPGVYSLAEGSRVYQAVESAGGFTDEADPDYLNMAQPLSDGMRLEIPDRETAKLLEAEDPGRGMQPVQTAAAQAAVGSVGSGPDGRRMKVNINTASTEELTELSGIGKARAADIIAYREEHGPFQKIEDIMKVSGIKEAAFEKIKEDITV